MVPDQRRAAILRAAGDLFSQQPYADVSVADIAAAAAVSPPLIVFHFGTKKALYLAILAAAADAIRAGLADLAGPPSLDRLRAGVRFYADYALAHRAGFLSLLRGGQESAEAAAIVESVRADIAAQIQADLAAAGPPLAALSASPLTPVAVRAHLGYVDAAVVHWLALPADERAQLPPAMLADLTAGAFTGALAVLRSGGPPEVRLCCSPACRAVVLPTARPSAAPRPVAGRIPDRAAPASGAAAPAGLRRTTGTRSQPRLAPGQQADLVVVPQHPGRDLAQARERSDTQHGP
jgi:AcrR family transcriptional regulator